MPNYNTIMDRYRKYLTSKQISTLRGLRGGIRQTYADERRDAYLEQRRAMNRIGQYGSAMGLGEGYIARKQAMYDRELDKYSAEIDRATESAYENEVKKQANATISARNAAARARARAAQAQADAEAAAYQNRNVTAQEAYAEYHPRPTRAEVQQVHNNQQPQGMSNVEMQEAYAGYHPRPSAQEITYANQQRAAYQQSLVEQRAQQEAAQRLYSYDPSVTTVPKASSPEQQMLFDETYAASEGMSDAELKAHYRADVARYDEIVNSLDTIYSFDSSLRELYANYQAEIERVYDLSLTPEQRRIAAGKAEQYQRQYNEMMRSNQMAGYNRMLPALMQELNALVDNLDAQKYVLAKRGVTYKGYEARSDYQWERENGEIPEPPTEYNDEFWEHAEAAPVYVRGSNVTIADRTWFDENGYGDAIDSAIAAYKDDVESSSGFSAQFTPKTAKELLEHYEKGKDYRRWEKYAEESGRTRSYYENPVDYNTVYNKNEHLRNDAAFDSAKNITAFSYKGIGEAQDYTLTDEARGWLERHGYEEAADKIDEWMKVHGDELEHKDITLGELYDMAYGGRKYLNEQNAQNSKLFEDALKDGGALEGLFHEKSWLRFGGSDILENLFVPGAALRYIYDDNPEDLLDAYSYYHEKAIGGIKNGKPDEKAMELTSEFNYLAQLLRDGKDLTARKVAVQLMSEYYQDKVGAESENMGSLELFGRMTLAQIADNIQKMEDFFSGKSTVTGRRQAMTAAYQQRVRDEWMANGKTDNEKKNWGWWADVFTGSLASLADNAPARLAGLIPYAGKFMSPTMFFLSAGGNARQEALREGASSGQATGYSIAIGALETGLEKLIGGIPLGGKSTLSSAMEQFVKMMPKAWLRFIANMGVDAAGEFTEEYLQEVLDPVMKNLFLDHNEKMPFFTEEALAAGLSGALSSIFGGMTDVRTARSALSTLTDYNTLRKAGLSAKDAEFYIKTNELIRSNEEVSDKDLMKYLDLQLELVNAAKNNRTALPNVGQYGARPAMSEVLDSTDMTADYQRMVEEYKATTDESERARLAREMGLKLVEKPATAQDGKLNITTVDGKPLNYTRLSSEAKATYALAKKISELFPNVSIYAHDTLPYGNGIMHGEKDGSIHIALDATNADGDAKIASDTLAHEYTHLLRLTDEIARANGQEDANNWGEFLKALEKYYSKAYGEDKLKAKQKEVVDEHIDDSKQRAQYYKTVAEAVQAEVTRLVDEDTEGKAKAKMEGRSTEEMINDEYASALAGELFSDPVRFSEFLDRILEDRTIEERKKKGIISKFKNMLTKIVRAFRSLGRKTPKALRECLKSAEKAYRSLETSRPISDLVKDYRKKQEDALVDKIIAEGKAEDERKAAKAKAEAEAKAAKDEAELAEIYASIDEDIAAENKAKKQAAKVKALMDLTEANRSKPVSRETWQDEGKQMDALTERISDVLDGMRLQAYALGQTDIDALEARYNEILDEIERKNLEWARAIEQSAYPGETEAHRKARMDKAGFPSMRQELKALRELEKQVKAAVNKPGEEFRKGAETRKSGESAWEKRDGAYMPLAEKYKNGTATAKETAELERQVREAARKAGYTVQAYHGTSRGGFNIFDYGKRRFGLFGEGFYFTEDKSVADTYQQKGKGSSPQTYSVFLNVGNELDMDAKADVDAWIKSSAENADLDIGAFLPADKANLTNTDCFKALTEAMEYEGVFRYEAGDIAEGVIIGMGYDGLTHKGGIRRGDKEHTVHVVFDAGRIKSADPVTYDDNGNIIPLSERFNEREDDIRWELRQTQGMSWAAQMKEYFSPNHGSLKSSDALTALTNSEIYNGFEMKNVPIGILVSTIKKAMRTEKGSRSAHNISEAIIKNLGKTLADPVAIIDNPSRNCIYVITGDVDNNGDPVVAVIQKNSQLSYADAHIIKSIYGMHDLIEYIKNHIPNGSRIEVNKKAKLSELLLGRGVQFAKLGTILGEFANVIVNENETSVNPVTQEISSAGTSIKQVPALFKKPNVKFGKTNIDIGGGKYDLATNYLAERGTKNYLFDPYNQSEGVNAATLKFLMDGNRADTVTCANVLNVIAEAEARRNVILEAAKAVKKDGRAYFMVYEGDGSGAGRKTSAGWQNNRKTADYIEEISQFFENVSLKDKVITASDPISDLPKAQWETTPGNATLWERRSYDPDFTFGQQINTKTVREAVRTGEAETDGRFDLAVDIDGRTITLNVKDKQRNKTYTRTVTAAEDSDVKAFADRKGAETRKSGESAWEKRTIPAGDLDSNLSEEGEIVGDVEVDANGSFNRWSVRTIPATQNGWQKLIDNLVKAGNTQEQAEKWVNNMYDIAAAILADKEGILDYESDPRSSWLRKNSDYPQGTIDFSNNCPRKAEQTAQFNLFMKNHPELMLTAEDMETIRDIIKTANIPVTCGGCFVEERRQHLGEVAQMFIDKLNAAIRGETGDKALAPKFFDKVSEKDKGYRLTLKDIVTDDGFKALYENHFSIYDAFVAYNNARGMQSIRLTYGLSEYNNGISKWNASTIRAKNNRGGIRVFSYSDADVRIILDFMQIITDAAAKKVMMQGYTKKPWFARLAKDTGARLLRSHIPLGKGYKTVNGKNVLVYDNFEGIDTQDADYLAIDRDNDLNIGNNVIGCNDEMILLAMIDDYIDQIIPFHSGLKESIRNQKKIGDWVNYKLYQADKVRNAEGAWVTADKQVNIYTEVINRVNWATPEYHEDGTLMTDAERFVNRYLEVCREKGYKPRFAQFLNDENGERVADFDREVKEYTYRKGYEKFLVDFRLFDKNGKIILQEAVKPVFDNEYINELFRNYIKENPQAKPANADVAAKIEAAMKEKYGTSDMWERRSYDPDFTFGQQIDTGAVREAVRTGEAETDGRFDLAVDIDGRTITLNVKDKQRSKTYTRTVTAAEDSDVKAFAERYTASTLRNILRGKPNAEAGSTAGIYFKKGENPKRDVNVPEWDKAGKKVTRFTRTIAEALDNEEMAQTLVDKAIDGAFSYEILHNKDAIQYADELVDTDMSAAQAHWEDAQTKIGIPTPNDIAVGSRLLHEAAESGNVEDTLMLADELAQTLRRAGQAVQAARLLKQMGPAGTLFYITRAIAKINLDLQKSAARYRVTINSALVDQLLHAQTDEEIDAARDAIINDIAAQIKPSLSDMASAWRYLSMLFNTRTHTRNVLGNAFFMPAVLMKNIVATGIEAVTQKNNRTKKLIYGKEYRDFAKWDWKNTAKRNFEEMGNKYEDVQGITSAIEQRRRKFPKWMKPVETLSKINSTALSQEDIWFKHVYYNTALASYLAARKVDVKALRAALDAQATGVMFMEGSKEAKLIEEYENARDYAIKEANRNTYNDVNAFAQVLQRASRSLKSSPNLLAKGGHYLLEGLVPFKITPANIVQRAVEYSPLGLVKSVSKDLIELRKGNLTANEVIDHVAQGLTGTALVAVGVLLAKAGLLKGGYGYDKDDQEEKRKGHQSYALEVGGVSYTLDWLAPESIPLFTGVEFYRMLNDSGMSDEGIWKAVGNAMTSMLEPIVNMSMLEGVQNAFTSIKYSDNVLGDLAIALAGSYVGQFVPTFFGQVARTIDPYQRRSYSDKNSALPRAVDKIWQSVIKKVPFANKLLEPYIDPATGEAETDPLAMRILENFFSPGYISFIKETAPDSEIARLMDTLGDEAVKAFPTAANKKFSYGGEDYNLTAKEYTSFAEVRGKTAYAIIERMIETDEYKALSDRDKVKAYAAAYDYANTLAKSAVLDMRLGANAPALGDIEKWVGQATQYAKLPGGSEDAISQYITLKTLFSDPGFSYGDVPDASANDMKFSYIMNDDSIGLLQKFYLLSAFGIKQKFYANATEAMSKGYTLTQCKKVAEYARGESGQGMKSRIIEYAMSLGMTRERAEQLYEWFK